jgi:hypothetical protein
MKRTLETCAPNGVRITKPLAAANTVFIDKVDDEGTEERADARDSICECDVHGRRVVRLVEWWTCVCGENCGVEGRPDSERELRVVVVVTKGRNPKDVREGRGKGLTR